MRVSSLLVWLGVVSPLSMTVVLDNTEATVRFAPDEDSSSVAAAFCSSHGILQYECTPRLAAKVKNAQAAHLRAAKVVAPSTEHQTAAVGWDECHAVVYDSFPRLWKMGEAHVLHVTGAGFNCLRGANATLSYGAKFGGGIVDTTKPAQRVARVNDSHVEIQFDPDQRQTPGVATVHLHLMPLPGRQTASASAVSVMLVDHSAVDMPPQLHLGCGRDLIPGKHESLTFLMHVCANTEACPCAQAGSTWMPSFGGRLFMIGVSKSTSPRPGPTPG